MLDVVWSMNIIIVLQNDFNALAFGVVDEPSSERILYIPFSSVEISMGQKEIFRSSSDEIDCLSFLDLLTDPEDCFVSQRLRIAFLTSLALEEEYITILVQIKR